MLCFPAGLKTQSPHLLDVGKLSGKSVYSVWELWLAGPDNQKSLRGPPIRLKAGACLKLKAFGLSPCAARLTGLAIQKHLPTLDIPRLMSMRVSQTTQTNSCTGAIRAALSTIEDNSISLPQLQSALASTHQFHITSAFQRGADAKYSGFSNPFVVGWNITHQNLGSDFLDTCWHFQTREKNTAGIGVVHITFVNSTLTRRVCCLPSWAWRELKESWSQLCFLLVWCNLHLL